MHTVIITNTRSTKLLQEYRTLFQPFVESGTISFCQWNESGTDLISSVPELCKTIEGKHNWRAVIVVQPEQSEKERSFNEKNPFDFNAGNGADLHLTESSVPLIRLCHMLAGFPALGVKEFCKAFVYTDEETGVEHRICEDEISEEELLDLSEQHNHSLRVTYIEQEYSDEETLRHKQLSRLYEFPEERPAEIVLISTRDKTGDETKQKVLSFWQNNRETESSDFWKRNNYPNTCRFLCYDLTNTENSLYARELMTFWLAVLSVAINRIAPSTLQAYRLYRLDILVDHACMGRELNHHISRMLASRDTVRERMNQRPNFSFGEEDELVTEQTVPVVFEQTTGGDLQVEVHVGLSRDCPTDEGKLWTAEMQQKRKTLDRFLKAPRRAVDVAAEYARDRAESFVGREYELDKFQQEDLRELVEKLEWDVVSAETRSILDTKKYKADLQQADREVRRCIDGRMKKRTVLAAGIAALLLYLIGWLPYLWSSIRLGGKVFAGSLAFAVGMTALVSVGGLIALFVLRGRLRGKIAAFNEIMQHIAERVNAGAKKFEVYLTQVCTYMKAQSILAGMTLKQESQSSSRNLLRAHHKALNSAIHREAGWCAAFGIQRENEPISNSSLFFSAEILPRDNPVYRLTPAEQEIPINDTGDMVSAPYPFVTKILVEREELYDTVKGDGNG